MATKKPTSSKAPPRSTSKRNALGRGLSAMLERSDTEQQQQDQASLRELPVDLIRPGRYQPRMVMDKEKLQELANSISAQGMVQPVIVRPSADNAYELIAGERRWRAAQLAGLSRIPAVIRDVSDEITVAMALIENIQREDLNPLEEAGALQRLITEFDMTHQQAGEAVGRSRAAVSNLLRLLELEPAVQKLVNAGELDMGHARALLVLRGNEQIAAARHVAQKQLSVRATEQYLAGLQKQNVTAGKRKPAGQSVDTLRLQQKLSEQLGAPVQIRHKASGAGQLLISYHDLDELDGIIAKFSD
ncbi:MAG: ParB/RepB/Spo0J family partition protein [Gammaproteobacteria bacterium]|jgi:ParB family chromosome partitioning protein|nr:ParB/RepB/Spo0J family partition protein [Gammaproteobacteria bacterium]